MAAQEGLFPDLIAIRQLFGTSMQHIRSLQGVRLQNAWLTIGSFDGVHRGHQEIVQRLTTGAHAVGSPAVVLTFYPHPGFVLGKRKTPYYLTTPEERAMLLEKLGVDVVMTLPFDLPMSATSPHEFLAMLKAHLDISHLLVGQDFALGRNREGTVSVLQQFDAEFGYTLEVIPSLTNGGEAISSTRIRQALAEGDVSLAAALLGRFYNLSGEVIPGDGRGRRIGISTANLDVWAERAIPKVGVYVCRAKVGDTFWGAVTNIGMRPTFETQPGLPRIETHLIDLDENLYGKRLDLEFLAYLRDEQRFSTIQSLVTQIEQDVRQAREILDETKFDLGA